MRELLLKSEEIGQLRIGTCIIAYCIAFGDLIDIYCSAAFLMRDLVFYVVETSQYPRIVLRSHSWY